MTTEQEDEVVTETAEELLCRIANYGYTRFRIRDKQGRWQWIYVKQITRREYDEA